MKSTAIMSAALLTLSILVSGAAIAQQAQGQHHPGSGDGMAGPGAQMGQGMMGPGMMQSGMGMMGQNCPMMGGGQSGTFAEGRIAFLKAELAITDKQKSVFDAYSEALKENLENMTTMRQSMMVMMSAKTPIERLDAHLTIMEGRLSSLKSIKPMLKALYTALNDEQKKKADEILTGMGCMM